MNNFEEDNRGDGDSHCYGIYELKAAVSVEMESSAVLADEAISVLSD